MEPTVFTRATLTTSTPPRRTSPPQAVPEHETDVATAADRRTLVHATRRRPHGATGPDHDAQVPAANSYCQSPHPTSNEVPTQPTPDPPPTRTARDTGATRASSANLREWAMARNFCGQNR